MDNYASKSYNINMANHQKKYTNISINGDVENVIRQSASSLTLLYIHYNDTKGSSSVRQVEPYEIKDGGLYAYCHNKNAIRRFNLSGISQARTTNIPFTPKWEIKI